ncbi:hypothetical protein [Roseivivax sp. CAU 1753]
MSDSSRKKRLARILASAEGLFGEKVRDVEHPGGEGRSSCRLIFADRTVIATLRPNFRRAHLEAFALSRIARHCDDTPECLGVDEEIIYQSDVGSRRLNQEIAKVSRTRRKALAEESVAAIFRIQRAAAEAGLNEAMPHLGVNRDWLDNLAGARDALVPFSKGRGVGVDHDALCAAIAVPARQFVKWDCRSGNAAIGDDDRLRWFDFEYAGVRHGAEDLAWLIGDEAWPVSGPAMEDIVRDALGPMPADARDAYLDYLGVYTTLHCVQRFKLIIKEAKKRGWLSKTRVRKYDDAGVHPEFASHLCGVAAHFGDRSALTRPIARDFEDARRVFDQMIREAA